MIENDNVLIFKGASRLDGDAENKINADALHEACEARAAIEGTPLPQDAEGRKRYDNHMRSAFKRMFDKAAEALPDLKKEREAWDRLDNEARTKPPDQQGTELKERAHKKWVQHSDNVEETLKRLCYPPSV